MVNGDGVMVVVDVVMMMMMMVVVVEVVVKCLEEVRRRAVCHLLRSEGGLASLEDPGHLLSYSLSSVQTPDCLVISQIIIQYDNDNN